MDSVAEAATGPGRSWQSVGHLAKRAVAAAEASGADLPRNARGMAASAIAKGADPASVFAAFVTPADDPATDPPSDMPVAEPPAGDAGPMPPVPDDGSADPVAAEEGGPPAPPPAPPVETADDDPAL